MIAEIVKASKSRGMIEYNEQKVEEGHATRIYDSTLSGNPKEIREIFENNALLNDRIRKNKFQHVIVSFHKSDQVSNDKFMEIWKNYTEQMGYKDFNHVIYQHHDTHLNHYHVVMPTVDVAGNKFSDYKDFINNRDLTRKLEKDFGLYEIKYEGFDKRQQHSMNADQYSIYNLIKRKEALEKENISLGSSFSNSIRKYKMTNDEIRDNYGSASITFDKLKAVADKYTQSPRGQLIKDLLNIKRSSKNYEDFELKVQAAGLYIKRYFDDYNKTYRMVYGNKTTTTYIKNSKLPKALRYDYLFAEKEKEFSRADQIKFLKNIAIRTSRTSRSFGEYVNALNDYNIEVETKSNKNGVYAYSLKSNSINNGEFIPASEIYRQLSMAKLPFMASSKVIKKGPKPGLSKTAGLNKLNRLVDFENDIALDEIRKKEMEEREQDDLF